MCDRNALVQRVICITAMVLFLTTALMADALAATKLKVFILAGQSNAAGIALKKDLPPDLQQPQKNVKVYGIGGSGEVMGVDLPSTDGAKTTNGWGDLRPNFWAENCQVGSYLTLGRDLAAAMPDDSIGIIVACAISTLADEWRPPSSGGAGSAYSGPLMDGVKKAIAALGPDYEAEIVGMCWMQGESDAMDEASADAYQANLTNLINDLRKDYDLPRMPFVIAMIDSANQWHLADTVRAAEMAVAKKLPNVGILDTHGYPKNEDGGHYNASGHMVLGSTFAANLLRLINNPAPGALVEPSDLVATALADGKVQLTWRDNSSTETGFTVERKAGDGPYEEIGTADAGTAVFASYTDPSVPDSTVYTYRVKAVNGPTSTAYSNEIEVSPLGAGNGLKAEYFKDTKLRDIAFTRPEPTIDFNWNAASPGEGIAEEATFSARWTGFVQPHYTDTYTFFVASDMTARVWVNNQQIVNHWAWDYVPAEWQGVSPIHCGSIRLEAGRVYPIKVEYYVTDQSEGRHIQLKWQSLTSQEMQVVPRSQLYQDAPPR